MLIIDHCMHNTMASAELLRGTHGQAGSGGHYCVEARHHAVSRTEDIPLCRMFANHIVRSRQACLHILQI